MTLVLTITGLLVVALVARDLFHQIFHPAGQGRISDPVMRAVFAATRAIGRRKPAAMNYAGPLGSLLSVVAWAALLAVGWALVYMPHLPHGFRIASNLDVSQQGGFGDALYLSLVTLSTLGYGDISPTAGWLRVLAPIEAMMGFALFTASLTWVLSLYPVLGRHRAFAHRVLLLTNSDAAIVRRLAHADPTAATLLLSGVAADVTQIRSDLIEFPSSIYFHSPLIDSSLAGSLLKLEALASSLDADDAPVRQATALVRQSVADLAGVLNKRGVGAQASKPREVLREYARMHRRIES